MRFLVSWHFNTVFNGMYKGAECIEAGDIEEASKKCREKVTSEQFPGENPARVRVDQVNIYK